MKKCIVPRCGKKRGKARGLCDSCYETARIKVNAHEWTWAELERLKLALPKQKQSRQAAISKAMK